MRAHADAKQHTRSVPGATGSRATLTWAAKHAGELGGNPDQLMVMGDSAGGALAALSAVRARDEGEPSLRLQVLIYPMIGPALCTAPRSSLPTDT